MREDGKFRSGLFFSFLTHTSCSLRSSRAQLLSRTYSRPLALFVLSRGILLDELFPVPLQPGLRPGEPEAEVNRQR